MTDAVHPNCLVLVTEGVNGQSFFRASNLDKPWVCMSQKKTNGIFTGGQGSHLGWWVQRMSLSFPISCISDPLAWLQRPTEPTSSARSWTPQCEQHRFTIKSLPLWHTQRWCHQAHSADGHEHSDGQAWPEICLLCHPSSPRGTSNNGSSTTIRPLICTPKFADMQTARIHHQFPYIDNFCSNGSPL